MFSPTFTTFTLGAFLTSVQGYRVRPVSNKSPRDNVTCPDFVVSTDHDASGSLLLEQGAASMEECCALCSTTEGCDAWSYAAGWSTCYIKSGFLGAYANQGITAGYRPPDGIMLLPMYRATEGASVRWTLENNDLADAGGVLKYMHTEIVVEHEQNPSRTTRKHNIDVVAQLDFRVKNSPALLADGHMRTHHAFGPFVTYDRGRSTNPFFDDVFPTYGDWVGVQNHRDDPRIEADYDLWWYSLGGFCPNLRFSEKGSHEVANPECAKYDNPPSWANAEPGTMALAGGLCSHGEYFPTGEAGCVYNYDHAFEVVVSLDQISNLTGHDCGGHMCADWSEFRSSCSDQSLRRRFSRENVIEDTDYCVEYDIAPACARNCASEECLELMASNATIELGIPFWQGRCDAGANRQRRDTFNSFFRHAQLLTHMAD